MYPLVYKHNQSMHARGWFREPALYAHTTSEYRCNSRWQNQRLLAQSTWNETGISFAACTFYTGSQVAVCPWKVSVAIQAFWRGTMSPGSSSPTLYRRSLMIRFAWVLPCQDGAREHPPFEMAFNPCDESESHWRESLGEMAMISQGLWETCNILFNTTKKWKRNASFSYLFFS